MQSTAVSRIQFEAESSVARILLRNPPLNVIDIPMMEELSHAIDQVEADSTIACVVFEGAPKAFSAGVDVGAHAPQTVATMLRQFHSVITKIVNSSKVTIAAVNGHCLGGGAELAMVCDIVITAESAVWGFPEIKLGCYPPVAAAALASLVGQKRATDLILTGRCISGSEAAAIGLATTASRDVQGALSARLIELSGLSAAALKVTKQALYHWRGSHFDKGLERAEKIYLEELMKTRDANEGIEAFMQKRPPKWSGN